ncbi:MAG: exodeoxyribonuclease VII large subunit, partial [Clostridia bacterium]|nr:exodeoxyribonuclease VII large subunit [Clostridia bacterium]
MEQAISVGQLNDYIKMMIDNDRVLSDVLLRGEISNFTNHYKTGHFYFSLKDENALVRAVMFRSYASRVKFLPESGMKVIVHGRISVFPRDGQYQIYVDEMLPDGVGSLYLAFEQLRKRLEGEGLFDPTRKRPLPPLPKRIGLITSPTGAAVRDM